jgi:reductive dehalogenase
MPPVSSLILLLAGLVPLLGFAWFGIVSVRENEPRAARVAFLLSVAGALPCFGAAGLSQAGRIGALATIGCLTAAALVLLFVPVGGSVRGNGRPERRVDEREILFARRRLRPGSPEFERYYAMHPEHRESDDRTRALPGLLSPKAKKFEPAAFASAGASFALTEALRHSVNGPPAPDRLSLAPAEATALTKRLARYYGALDVGVAEIRPYHVYTHVGRGSGTWGESIDLSHRWALAFTVEMDHAAMRHAPEAPVVAESARQYVEAARTAVQLASAIRAMGHPARAHIDGNYRVIAPLVAVDAGLGEIGRMGLLMTPRLGPRVRLGVVTTDLPLVPDRPGDDPTVIDFCRICRKCAACCPSQSIPFDDRRPIDSALRWAIDADSCFRYWNAVGTDCGRCMAVCPYSHPDHPAHNLVRWAARRSAVARRTLLWMDDLFYGRRPGGIGRASAAAKDPP